VAQRERDRFGQRAFVAARDRDARTVDPVRDAADRVGHRGPSARLRFDPDETERLRFERGDRDDRRRVDRRA